MKYQITKKQAIKAICTEPLEAGAFFSSGPLPGWKDKEGRSVCAVGALLRKTKPSFFSEFDAQEVTDGKYAPHEIDEAYECGNFWAILSTEFENYYDASHEVVSTDEARLHCLSVIEAFMPEVLEFEV